MEKNKKRLIPVSSKMFEYAILRFASLIYLWKQSTFTHAISGRWRDLEREWNTYMFLYP